MTNDFEEKYAREKKIKEEKLKEFLGREFPILSSKGYEVFTTIPTKERVDKFMSGWKNSCWNKFYEDMQWIAGSPKPVYTSVWGRLGWYLHSSEGFTILGKKKPNLDSK